MSLQILQDQRLSFNDTKWMPWTGKAVENKNRLIILQIDLNRKLGICAISGAKVSVLVPAPGHQVAVSVYGQDVFVSGGDFWNGCQFFDSRKNRSWIIGPVKRSNLIAIRLSMIIVLIICYQQKLRFSLIITNCITILLKMKKHLNFCFLIP